MPFEELYRVRAPRPLIRWSAALVISAVVAVGAARVAQTVVQPAGSIASLDAVSAGIVSALDGAVRP